jgi:hypothetical protein
MFVGSERAGKRAAAIQSLLYTEKLNGLDPAAWLRDTLEKLPTCPNSQIDSLLPLRAEALQLSLTVGKRGRAERLLSCRSRVSSASNSLTGCFADPLAGRWPLRSDSLGFISNLRRVKLPCLVASIFRVPGLFWRERNRSHEG